MPAQRLHSCEGVLVLLEFQRGCLAAPVPRLIEFALECREEIRQGYHSMGYLPKEKKRVVLKTTRASNLLAPCVQGTVLTSE